MPRPIGFKCMKLQYPPRVHEFSSYCLRVLSLKSVTGENSAAIGRPESVPGDHDRLGACDTDRDLKRIDHPQEAAPIMAIDDGIHVGPENVTQVEHVGFDEMDEAVTVGVSGRR